MSLRPIPELLTVADAAAETGLKERTIRHLFDTRAVPLVKIGTRLYVRRADLVAYLDSATVPAAGPERRR
ncbi:hypothetical protein TESS_TESS_00852 [Tessaracoccus sp. O5.2]|uniref:helix-turn-helix domain-containing protein n=1 Tax=Tessaracoccus sp. O5.2 TaxID=3157622 RepID=UPI0035E4A226